MSLRGVSAAFDAIAMIAFAYTVTGGSFADRGAVTVIWGSAAAAVVAALVVLTASAPAIGWAAIGYVLFAAFLAAARPVPLLGLLALAFMPILPRPRGSLVAGLAISIVVAIAVAVVARRL